MTERERVEQAVRDGTSDQFPDWVPAAVYAALHTANLLPSQSEAEPYISMYDAAQANATREAAHAKALAEALRATRTVDLTDPEALSRVGDQGWQALAAYDKDHER
jgi:hypothetical protein